MSACPTCGKPADQPIRPQRGTRRTGHAVYSTQRRDALIGEGWRLVNVVVDGAGEGCPVWVMRPPRGRR